jgi:Fur family transcriptional regulator, iron response regulator
MTPKNSKHKKPRGKYDSSAALLKTAGLRPTRQRLALARWLFGGGNKHVTADQVHAAAIKMRVRVSLATIYNTLNKFSDKGLLCQRAIDGGQVYFDTNTELHHHIFDEKTRRLSDIPASSVSFAKLPRMPSGKVLSCIDVVLRIRGAK